MELSAQEHQRFWAKVRKDPGDDGCWIWTAGTWSSGEPAFYLGDRVHSARRIAYFLHHGVPCPATPLKLFPPCFTKRCIRHLTSLTTTDTPYLSPKDLARFWGYIQQSTDPPSCWIWHGPLEQARYPTFQAQHHKWSPARLVYMLTDGPVPEGLHVIHDPTCTNHLCVRHTMLSTKKSTHLRINAAHTKLTRDQVIALRKDHATGKYTLKDLAEIYRLRSMGQVSEIINRLAFATIP